VNFLVDAQLPARLARQLFDAGHDAIHCLGLPSGNRSSAAEIAAVADAGDRVVVTKDRDFRDAHLLRGVPGASSGSHPDSTCRRCWIAKSCSASGVPAGV